MKHVKTFESYSSKEEINEGNIIEFIKNIPFLKKYYNKAKEVYLKLKDDMDALLSKLGPDDLERTRNFDLSQLNSEMMPVEESNEKVKGLVSKILKILGYSTGAIGLISGLTAMILAEVNQSAYESQPWFIACVILMALAGFTYGVGDHTEPASDIKPKRPLVKKLHPSDVRARERSSSRR